MTIHAPSGTTSFEACLRLFERYPLAITLDAADGGSLSMVLLNRAAGTAGFFVLTQARDDLFVIRSWNRHDGVDQPNPAGRTRTRRDPPADRRRHAGPS